MLWLCSSWTAERPERSSSYRGWTATPVMPHEIKLLSGEQYLLTTLMVKLAVVAILSTMLVRFPWFRRILLTEKRDWPERFVFAASLGVPLTAGVLARLLLSYEAADLTLSDRSWPACSPVRTQARSSAP